MGWLSKMLGGDAPPAPERAKVVVDFVSVDVETSCSSKSSICQVGIVGFHEGREVLTYSALVDPRDEFDPFNVGLHGIDAHHVRGRPHFGKLYGQIADHLHDKVTVAHSSFDRGALSAAAAVYGRSPFAARWLDSVEVARRAWPQLPNHKLNTVANHLGLTFTHHDALNDARVAGLIVVRASEETGLGLTDWFASPRKIKARAPVAREGGAGPLAGHCVCMTGDFSAPKAEMADRIAAAGGAVTSTVSRKTTMLVLGVQDPSTFAGKNKSAKHIKALELQAAGQAIEIVDESGLRARMAI